MLHRRSYLLFRGRHEVALIWKSLAENPLGSYHFYLYFFWRLFFWRKKTELSFLLLLTLWLSFCQGKSRLIITKNVDGSVKKLIDPMEREKMDRCVQEIQWCSKRSVLLSYRKDLFAKNCRCFMSVKHILVVWIWSRKCICFYTIECWNGSLESFSRQMWWKYYLRWW